MKCSLGISNFLEEISSLSHSVLFPYFFALFAEDGFLISLIANIHWIIEKTGEFQKNIYLCFIDYAQDFDCVHHNKLWIILQEMGIPDHLTCLLINLYAGQKAKVKTGHGTSDWFQIGKGVCQGYILSPCLFNFYTSGETLGWKKHKLESRLLGEISITSDM